MNRFLSERLSTSRGWWIVLSGRKSIDGIERSKDSVIETAVYKRFENCDLQLEDRFFQQKSIVFFNSHSFAGRAL